MNAQISMFDAVPELETREEKLRRALDLRGRAWELHCEVAETRDEKRAQAKRKRVEEMEREADEILPDWRMKISLDNAHAPATDHR